MAESFVIYRSFHEALKDLPPEQYGRVMFAINEYALNGTEPELTGCEKAFFMLMRPQIDANTKRRENGKLGAEYGRKGGRPQNKNPIGVSESEKNNPIGVSNCEKENPKQTPNVNANANENENVNANDNANENANSGVSEETPGGSGGTPASAPDTPTPEPEKETHSEPFQNSIATTKQNIHRTLMVNKPGGIETALGLASELAQETAQRCNFSPANTDNPVHESPPEKPKPSPRFIKPSVEEIRAYCAERQNHLDAQSFYDFYESKGWMIGKDKMKDWRACIRTWEQRRKGEQTGGRTRPGGMWGSENAAADSYIDLM